MSNELKEIRKRHQMCEKFPRLDGHTISGLALLVERGQSDRGELLKIVDELEAQLDEELGLYAAWEDTSNFHYKQVKKLQAQLNAAIKWIQHDCPWEEAEIRQHLEKDDEISKSSEDT